MSLLFYRQQCRPKCSLYWPDFHHKPERVASISLSHIHVSVDSGRISTHTHTTRADVLLLVKMIDGAARGDVIVLCLSIAQGTVAFLPALYQRNSVFERNLFRQICLIRMVTRGSWDRRFSCGRRIAISFLQNKEFNKFHNFMIYFIWSNQDTLHELG